MKPTDLNKTLAQIARKTISVYNKIYNESVDVNSDLFKELVAAYTLISLYGWKGVEKTYSDPVMFILRKVFPVGYEGANKTTVTRLNALKTRVEEDEADVNDVTQFRSTRVKEIIEGSSISLFQSITALAAMQTDRYKYVGAITREDNRVRPKHVRHNRKYWPVGSYSPWFDYGCRCRYFYFKTVKEAVRAGFTEL